MTEFSTFKINFRSADAANHVNRDAQHIPEVTRRAYIPKIQSLKSNTGPVGGQLAPEKKRTNPVTGTTKVKYA